MIPGVPDRDWAEETPGIKRETITWAEAKPASGRAPALRQERKNKMEDFETMFTEEPETAGQDPSVPEEDTQRQDPEQSRTEDDAQQASPEQNQSTGIPEENTEQAFLLRHLGREYSLPREETVRLAQKGMDYDRIRKDRDSLHAFRDKAEQAYDLIAAMAADNHTDVPDLIARIEAKRMEQKGTPAEKARQLAERSAAQEKARREKNQLQRLRPELDIEALPGEVWEEVREGQGLVSAYLDYENSRLRAQLAAMKSEQINRERAAGTRRSAGQADAGDSFLSEFLRG